MSVLAVHPADERQQFEQLGLVRHGVGCNDAFGVVQRDLHALVEFPDLLQADARRVALDARVLDELPDVEIAKHHQRHRGSVRRSGDGILERAFGDHQILLLLAETAFEAQLPRHGQPSEGESGQPLVAVGPKSQMLQQFGFAGELDVAVDVDVFGHLSVTQSDLAQTEVQLPHRVCIGVLGEPARQQHLPGDLLQTSPECRAVGQSSRPVGVAGNREVVLLSVSGVLRLLHQGRLHLTVELTGLLDRQGHHVGVGRNQLLEDCGVVRLAVDDPPVVLPRLVVVSGRIRLVTGPNVARVPRHVLVGDETADHDRKYQSGRHDECDHLDVQLLLLLLALFALSHLLGS